MEQHALNPRHLTTMAEYEIRKEFQQKLSSLPGPPITLDRTSIGAPELTFSFIDKCKLGEGVYKLDDETVVGCGHERHGVVYCKPNMGQEIGCEYSRVCDCLEYAPVDGARLTQEQRALYEAGETIGVPKRFPYASPFVKHAYCLVDFYLTQREMIYECNAKCNCGEDCKTRVVQKGRQVPLEIFKTNKRGWGE